MITRAIDTSHDWTFGAGSQNYLKEREALLQNIDTRVVSFLGDCFFDTDAGIDWFNLLGSKNLNGIKLAVSTVIINTTGVRSLEELEFSVSTNRQLTIKYAVQSNWGVEIPGILTLG